MVEVQVGIDIQKIDDFESISKNVYSKIFSEDEFKSMINLNAEQITARFCCKEAVIKALYGFDLAPTYKDIYISKNGKKPVVNVKGNEKISIDVSISHSEEFATAVAVAWRDE